MRISNEEGFLYNLIEDFRHFLRSRGLVAVTTVLLVLILLFIVFPIGSVLVKSFTVTYPTVTIRCQHALQDETQVRDQVIRPVLAALKGIEGIEEVRPAVNPGAAVVVLRFHKHWDDLKGLHDAKRLLKKTTAQLAPYGVTIKYRLGQETLKSFSTYVEFFSDSYYYRAFRNSVVLACVTTTLVTLISFCFAFVGLKGPRYVKGPMRILGLLPLVAPPFIFALALILIGGRSGMLTKLLHLPFNIYGWPGVIIAQAITFLPLGYLMIENVLRSLGTNLEDAASDMRASDIDILFKITIPLAAPGITKAALLVFLMSIADFGNPMLIGGGLSFLATDAYFLWMSENNLEMAAVFCVFLVMPSLLMFILHEYVLKGKAYTTIGGKPQQSEKRKMNPKIFFPMMAITSPVSIMIVMCFGMIFFGAFTEILMVDNSFTLAHFQSSNGLRSLVTSVKFALSAASIAPILGVTIAYVLVRKRIPFKKALEFMSLLGFAVPGTVLGVGYIIFFNHPPLKLTGTFILMIINEAFRNLSVSLEAGSSKLHQIDIAIEEAAVDMGASPFRTFTRIVLPLISSALVAGFVYTFMVGMIAVSAVIFLITPGNNLAALYILSVAEEGFLGMACAISLMLIMVVIACMGILKTIGKYTKTEVF